MYKLLDEDAVLWSLQVRQQTLSCTCDAVNIRGGPERDPIAAVGTETFNVPFFSYKSIQRLDSKDHMTFP